MTLKLHLHRVLIFIGAALFSVYVTLFIWQLWNAEFYRPLKFKELVVLNSPVKPGEELQIRSYRIKYRQCASVFDRFVVQRVEHEKGRTVVVARDSVPGGFSPLGEGYVEFTYKLPDDIPPGDYLYMQISRTLCGNNSYDDATPPGKFTVVAR